MKTVEQKRRRGRPATGRAPIVALRLSVEEIQIVDEFAAEWHVDRSKALRTLLREAFAASRRKEGRAKTTRRRAAAANAQIVEEVLAEARETRKPPRPPPRRRPGYARRLSPEEIKAAADRAEQRSRGR